MTKTGDGMEWWPKNSDEAQNIIDYNIWLNEQMFKAWQEEHQRDLSNDQQPDVASVKQGGCMHPLTKRIISNISLADVVVNLIDQIIRSYLTERAEWLKKKKYHTQGRHILSHQLTDEDINEALQLEPETCDKCGQVLPVMDSGKG